MYGAITFVYPDPLTGHTLVHVLNDIPLKDMAEIKRLLNKYEKR